MLIRQLLRARDPASVAYDICIPCWEQSAKLKVTLDNLMAGKGAVSAPCRLIINIEKQSVVRNRIACLAASTAPYVLWLDDDVTFIQPGWDRYLLDQIAAQPDVGIIGVRLLHWQLMERTFWRPQGQVDDVCGAVMMTRRLPGVGFDDNYLGSQWEDTDYCYEVRRAGYRILQNNQVQVVHFNEEKNSEHSHNRAYFNRKWGTNK